MSYFDDFLDYAYDGNEEYDQAYQDAVEGYWTTKGGERIAIKDMTTSHIKNCLAFIQHNDKNDFFTPFIDAFEEELKRRGEQ